MADEQLRGASTVSHRLFALDPVTGAVIGSRRIDPAGSDPTVEQQRAAVAIGNHRAYVTYGALAGDCGGYNGYVVASQTSMSGALDVYAAQQYVTGAGGGGIWAAPGASLDGKGNVYVAVGNGDSTTTYDLSDSILKLSPKLALRSYFAPTTWAQDNGSVADLGSTGPALVGRYVYADGKSGTAYLMRRSHLGHIGGQISSANVCQSFGGTALSGTTLFVPCTDGIRAVDVGTGTIHVAWHTTQTAAIGPPVIGGGAMWSLGINNGTLYALDPATGALIMSLSVGSVEHFATPALSGADVFVPTATGVVAVSGA